MSKALATFATGDHTRLLDVSAPLFAAYAERHGYQLVTVDRVPNSRPASWWKVPFLTALLDSFDEVLWLDCDVVIVDGTQDIASQVPTSMWQALVTHHTNEGEIPNCGVWFARKPMLPWLTRIWDMTTYISHPWWEQAAMLELLGYTPHQRPVRRETETSLFAHTAMLPLEWNSHEQNDRSDQPRFAHVTPNSVDWRLPIMQRYAQEATL